MNRLIKSIGEGCLNLLYPPRCPFCDRIPARGQIVCSLCAEKLPYIEEPVCRRCGRPVLPGDDLCDDCRETDRRFEAGEGLFMYDDLTRPALYALKYRGRADIGRALGALLYERKKERIREWQCDLAVPVPVHPGRLKARGYNQAAVIAGETARLAGLPTEPDAVRRRTETAALKEMSRTERYRAMADAFVPGKKVEDRRILLIDDIFTSGATCDAVSDALKEGGASSVHVLAVCIGVAFMIK